MHSPWADHAARCYGALRDLVSPAGLPPSALHQVWDHAIAAGSEAMVDGLYRIKRCTFEGRASMSYDLAQVERYVSGRLIGGGDASYSSASLDQAAKLFLCSLLMYTLVLSPSNSLFLVAV